jgi:hypothetical protein
MLYIDFKKAYDLVSHRILFEKLRKKRLGVKFIIGSIESLYRGTKLHARLGSELSDAFDYERGDKQGCPTSRYYSIYS